MLAGSNFIVTARIGRECVGLARCITDFAWICYLGDLAVCASFQGLGIGRGLVRTCKQLLGDDVSIALLSMPDAVDFYRRLGPELGLEPTPDAFYLPRRRNI